MMEPGSTSKPKTSGAAIASLVCGLIFCIPLTSLAAIILGIVGINKTKNPMVTGKGMAIAGILLGLLGLVGQAGTAYTVYKAVDVVLKTREPARLVAEQFTRNLAEGKVDEALAMSVEGTDRAALEAASVKLKARPPFQMAQLLMFTENIDNGKTDVSVSGPVVFGGDTKNFTMTMTKSGETLKVAKFDYPD